MFTKRANAISAKLTKKHNTCSEKEFNPKNLTKMSDIEFRNISLF